MGNEAAVREALAEAERAKERHGKRRREKLVRWSELESQLARKALENAGQGDDQDE